MRHRLQVPPVEGVEAEWQRRELRPRVRLGVWVPRVVLRGWHRLRVPQVPRVPLPHGLTVEVGYLEILPFLRI